MLLIFFDNTATDGRHHTATYQATVLWTPVRKGCKVLTSGSAVSDSDGEQGALPIIQPGDALRVGAGVTLRRTSC